jgi:hypothetical protein
MPMSDIECHPSMIADATFHPCILFEPGDELKRFGKGMLAQLMVIGMMCLPLAMPEPAPKPPKPWTFAVPLFFPVQQKVEPEEPKPDPAPTPKLPEKAKLQPHDKKETKGGVKPPRNEPRTEEAFNIEELETKINVDHMDIAFAPDVHQQLSELLRSSRDGRIACMETQKTHSPFALYKLALDGSKWEPMIPPADWDRNNFFALELRDTRIWAALAGLCTDRVAPFAYAIFPPEMRVAWYVFIRKTAAQRFPRCQGYVKISKVTLELDGHAENQIVIKDIECEAQ